MTTTTVRNRDGADSERGQQQQKQPPPPLLPSNVAGLSGIRIYRSEDGRTIMCNSVHFVSFVECKKRLYNCNRFDDVRRVIIQTVVRRVHRKYSKDVVFYLCGHGRRWERPR